MYNKTLPYPLISSRPAACHARAYNSIRNYTEYLKELQWRLLYILGGFLLAMGVCYGQRDIIFYLLVEPLEEVRTLSPIASMDNVNAFPWEEAAGSPGLEDNEPSRPAAFKAKGGNEMNTIVYMNITEAFNMSIYISVVVSLLVTVPLCWLQLWIYLVPALYAKEEKFLRRLIYRSFLFLVPSLMLTKNYLLPQIWSFFLSFDQSFPHITYMPSMMPYVQLSLQIYSVMIISAQGPLIIYWLTHWQWIKETFWVEKRSWIMMALLLWAAFLTPPDIYSLLIIFTPLWFFYELFLWFLFCKKAFIKSQ